MGTRSYGKLEPDTPDSPDTPGQLSGIVPSVRDGTARTDTDTPLIGVSVCPVCPADTDPAKGGRRSMRGPVWRRYDSVQRPQALIRWVLRHGYDRDDDLAPLFWKLVEQEWSGFDIIDHEAYCMLFARFRPWWRPPQAVSYRSLPEQFVVWRGVWRSGREWGLSWTLDRAVAEGFARGHRWMRNPNPIVVKAVINHDQVALALDDRRESELVLFAPPPKEEISHA